LLRPESFGSKVQIAGTGFRREPETFRFAPATSRSHGTREVHDVDPRAGVPSQPPKLQRFQLASGGRASGTCRTSADRGHALLRRFDVTGRFGEPETAPSSAITGVPALSLLDVGKPVDALEPKH
jgi:hypothetical protein